MKLEKIEFSNDIPIKFKIQLINKYPIHWHENITEIILPVKKLLPKELEILIYPTTKSHK